MSNQEQFFTLWKSMSAEERQTILSKIDNMSEITLTNETFITANETFATPIENYDNVYKRWISSDNENFILTAFTQIGKTDEIINLTNIFLKQNKIVIISADNKISQLNQIYNRFKKYMKEQKNFNTELFNLNDYTKDEYFKNDVINSLKQGNKVVIFMLDNYAQILHIQSILCQIIAKKIVNTNKILLIHDEGDVIQKDFEVEDPKTSSTKAWKDLIETFKLNYHLKRVFVSATPDNVIAKYQIEAGDILQLETVINYNGFDNMINIPCGQRYVKDNFEEQALKDFYNNKNSEIALLCIERCKKHTKNSQIGHKEIFDMVCKILPNCVVNTYNGDGIVVRIKNRKFKTELQKYIDNQDLEIEFERIERSTYHITGDMPICEFYEIMRILNERKIVTIGYDLIARGISFVSSKRVDNALAATTMIYKPSTKLSVVKLVQQIGRITGTARPDQERYLYTTQDVIDNYKKYHLNYSDLICRYNNGEIEYKTLQYEFELSRDIDRKNLKLKTHIVWNGGHNDGEIDGVKIQNIMKYFNGDLLVGKILRTLYYNGERMTRDELKKDINFNGKEDTLINDMKGGLGKRTQWGKIWICKNNLNFIELNPKIREYIDKQLEVKL